MGDFASDQLSTGPSDWINQRALCELLGISEHTGSIQAQSGLLKPFEHGVRNAGRRKYSRQLVEMELRIRKPSSLKRRREAAAKSKRRP